MKNYIILAKNLLDIGKSLGAEEIEIYLSQTKELTIEIANGQIETLKNAEEQGLGVRVVVNNQLGYAYSSDFSEPALKRTLEKAIFNAKKTSKDLFNRLPSQSKNYPTLDLFDEKIGETPVEEKIQLALAMEKAARESDSRIKITESCTYQDAQTEIAILNSNGIEKYTKGAYCGIFAFVVAEENGEAQTGFSMQFELKFDNLSPEKIGIEAGKKAVRMLGAEQVKTQKATVVLDPYVATRFLGVFAGAFSAEAVQKGKSFFANKLNTQVSSELIQIIDDGALKGGIASSPFDGEGVATGRTVLIEEGVLKNYLYNSYTAYKDKTSSTGNAVRGFRSTPDIGATNLFIDGGKTSQDELLKEIRSGFYITEVMGMHTANPISGDFSVGASGLLIENGKLTKPFRGAAIAGNLLDLFKRIDCVADDLTFFAGRGSPTLRIPDMTISGK